MEHVKARNPNWKVMETFSACFLVFSEGNNTFLFINIWLLPRLQKDLIGFTLGIILRKPRHISVLNSVFMERGVARITNAFVYGDIDIFFHFSRCDC